MIELPKTSGLVLLSSLLTVGWAAVGHGATSTMLDIPPSDILGSPDKVDVGNLKPLVAPKPAAAAGPPVSGNPLWSVPLSVLTVTQERPIFSASRRPPPRAVAGPRIEPVAPPPPKPPEPEHPALALIGAVVGDSDAIAVFLDRTNQGIVRLRAGEAHDGWVLSSVLRREVTLKKDDRTETLALQRPDSSPVAPLGIPVPPPLMQGVGNPNTSYAPFIPRSTPKNGESDGL
jgi:general secretion pathway protein N